MRLKTISRRLEEIISLINKRDKRFVDKLLELKAQIDYKIEEEEKKELNKNSAVYPLLRWYIELWKGEIPEGSASRVGKVLKELLEDFKVAEEEIKELYTFWLNLETVPTKLQKQYSILLTGKEARGIVDFKGKLRYIKALKREIETSGSKWTSKENERGIDYYLKEEEEEPEWWK